jgi:hypothetical protein
MEYKSGPHIVRTAITNGICGATSRRTVWGRGAQEKARKAGSEEPRKIRFVGLRSFMMLLSFFACGLWLFT